MLSDLWAWCQRTAARPFLWTLNAKTHRPAVALALGLTLGTIGPLILAPHVGVPLWAIVAYGIGAWASVMSMFVWRREAFTCWLARQDDSLWMRRHKGMMKELRAGGMGVREAFLLLRMHRHAELRGGEIDGEVWEEEHEAYNDLLDAALEEAREEESRGS